MLNNFERYEQVKDFENGYYFGLMELQDPRGYITDFEWENLVRKRSRQI